MGAICHSKPNNENRNRATSKGTTYKADEALKFYVKLSNFKGRTLPSTSSYVKVDFANEKTFKTPEMFGFTTNYLWNFKEEFELEINRRRLKTATVKFTLYDKEHKELCTASTNLIQTVVGPIHHDLIFYKNSKKTQARLTFDLKMSQRIKMNVKAEKIRCILAENPKEKEYNYSLKMIGHFRDFHSEHSSNFKNPLFKTNAIHDLREDCVENYQAKDFDEGGKLKTKNYFSAIRKLPTKTTKTEDSEGAASPKSEHSNLRGSRFNTKAGPFNLLVPNDNLKIIVDDEENSPKRKLTSLLKYEQVADDQTPTSPTLKDSPKNEARDIKRDLHWFNQGNEKDSPSMEMSISGSDFSTSSVQFFLWSVKTPEGQNRVDAIYIDHKLVGECYISLNKIYSEMNTEAEPIIEDEDATKRIVKKRVKISEKLWNHGVYIGVLEGEFICEYNPFYRQMICGVFSEAGVQKSTTVVLNNKNSRSIFDVFKGTLNKEVKALNQLKDTLIENVFKLSDNKNNQGKIIDDMASNLIKLLEILKSSDKESLTSFIYRSAEDLLTSQKVLIDLSKHLVEYCDQVPLTLRPLYYECLTSTILRGELELNFMGFDTETYGTLMESAAKSSFKNQNVVRGSVDVKNVKQKMKVATGYQTFLYETLEKVLKILNSKGLIDKERDFVETFCAVAYFRIPEFREKLLSCFNSSSEEGIAITEWRGTEWLLENGPDDRKKNQQFISLFDWDKNFYFYLKGTAKGDQNAEFLINVLNDTKWQKRFSKRGIAFYFFLSEWTKHVNKTVVIKDHVPWQDLPGYNVLIKNILIELKKKDVKYFPEALIETSVTLLKNEKLMNIFITIIYNKTRVYDSSNVFAVFEIVNTWLKALQTYQKNIPSTFDYNFFLKGLFMVIDGEHALNIAKALWVFYNNFNIFPAERKAQISEYLLGPAFFKLFLHWSFNVRQVFHHLLIFRFYHQHRQFNTNLNSLEDILHELQLYNQKRSDISKSQRNVLINEAINMAYSSCMTIIENARKKIIDDNQRLAVESKLRQRSNKYDRLKLQSSSNLLAKVHSLRRNSFTTSPLQGGLSISKHDSKGEGSEASFFLLNSDKLDTSMNFGNSIKANQVDDGFNPFLYDYDKIHSAVGLNKKDRRDLEVASSLQNIPSERSGDNKEKEDKQKQEQEQEQVVIYRKFGYYDKKAQRYNEIPKELLAYLIRAYGEFDEIKKNYLRWLQEFQLDISGKTEEEKKKQLANPPIPELIVKVPLDEGESDAIQPEDW